ncbi:MAG: hypothetical protein BAJALOKI1v1_160012 [Promethearchaeota archaeon]|nr:MAG: hypothetical protein BAJALOKI1v1_160012 [Candidatus Lokiarchaeota archaeon]
MITMVNLLLIIGLVVTFSLIFILMLAVSLKTVTEYRRLVVFRFGNIIELLDRELCF